MNTISIEAASNLDIIESTLLGVFDFAIRLGNDQEKISGRFGCLAMVVTLTPMESFIAHYTIHNNVTGGTENPMILLAQGEKYMTDVSEFKAFMWEAMNKNSEINSAANNDTVLAA